MGFCRDQLLVLLWFYGTLKVLPYLNVKNSTLFLYADDFIDVSGKDAQETNTLSITNLGEIQQFLNNNDLLLNLGKTTVCIHYLAVWTLGYL